MRVLFSLFLFSKHTPAQMKINDRKIEFENGKVLTFDFPIMKTLLHNGIIIVLLDKPPKIIFNENVYGVSNGGDLLWQIPKVEDEQQHCPFIDMHINEEGKLILRNWCHLNYEIDGKTGHVLSEEGYGW